MLTIGQFVLSYSERSIGKHIRDRSNFACEINGLYVIVNNVIYIDFSLLLIIIILFFVKGEETHETDGGPSIRERENLNVKSKWFEYQVAA